MNIFIELYLLDMVMFEYRVVNMGVYRKRGSWIKKEGGFEKDRIRCRSE